MKYKNKLTGKIVRYLAVGSTVPGHNLMAIYCPDDDENNIFIMEYDKFYEEYEVISSDSQPKTAQQN